MSCITCSASAHLRLLIGLEVHHAIDTSIVHLRGQILTYLHHLAFVTRWTAIESKHSLSSVARGAGIGLRSGGLDGGDSGELATAKFHLVNAENLMAKL